MHYLKQFVKKIFYPVTDDESDFSNQPQTYNVTQEVTLQAIGDVAGHLVLPAPASGEAQEVIAQTQQDLLFDGQYQNSYEALPFELLKSEKLKVVRMYQVVKNPTSQSAAGFSLDDYLSSARLDKRYLAENRYVKASLPQIQKVAGEIAQKHKRLADVLVAINSYVTTALRYGNPQTGLYSVTEALSGQPVDCGGFDTLFASICMALGIPARIVAGFWLGYEKNEMHAWVEAQLPDGKWLPVDPATENLRKAGRTKKSGSLGFVGSDRVVVSYGCDIKLDEKFGFTADILQVPFILPKSEQKKVIVVSKLQSVKVQ